MAKKKAPDKTLRERVLDTVESPSFIRTDSEFGYTVERDSMAPASRIKASEDNLPAQREVVNAEVMTEDSRFDKDLLRGIDSFETAAELYAETYGQQITFVQETELSDGFTHYKDSSQIKPRLVGVPVMLLEWKFVERTDGDFVFIRALVKTNDGLIKVSFTDGSKTGVYGELKDFTGLTRRTGGLVLPCGFRVSHFKYSEDLGRAVSPQEALKLVSDGKKVGDATIYYLDTSAA